MAAAISTLPRSAGNGAALIVVAADFIYKLFAPAAPAKVQAQAKATVAGPSVWKLYRMSAGSESINRKIAAKLHEMSGD